jgi:DNA polymerase III delta subunit
MTAPSADAVAWDFTAAVAERKGAEAVALFRQLLVQKQTAVGLLFQLETLFQLLLSFREYMDAGWLRLNGNRIQWSNDPELDDYFTALADDPRKMHWFRSGKLANQASPYTVRRLAASKRLVVDTHEQMISEGGIPHNLMFETMLAKLCAPQPRRRS